MKTKNDNRLFTNVCGNKQGLIKHLNDDYVTIIEPYAGSAAISLGLNTKSNLIWGETDRILYNCYDAWLAGTLELPQGDVNRDFLRESAQTTLNDLPCTINMETLGAAYVFRQSVYGSVMRTNKKGEINVRVADDKLTRILKRPIPKPPAQDVQLFPGAEQALAAAVQLDGGEKTLLVLDPPYYRPGSTPCYPMHDPNSRDETMWAIMNISTAITSGWDCLFTSYLDDSLMEVLNDIITLAAESGYTAKTLSDAALTRLGNQASGERSDKPNEVCIYFEKDNVEFDFL